MAFPAPRSISIAPRLSYAWACGLVVVAFAAVVLAVLS